MISFFDVEIARLMDWTIKTDWYKAYEFQSVAQLSFKPYYEPKNGHRKKPKTKSYQSDERTIKKWPRALVKQALDNHNPGQTKSGHTLLFNYYRFSYIPAMK